jgi:hypothetical protein
MNPAREADEGGGEETTQKREEAGAESAVNGQAPQTHVE